MDEMMMEQAILEAQKAYMLFEVPIGAVIVYEGQVIGRGYNRRNTDKNPLAHAEIMAINEAAGVIGDWRLEDCTMYVTLEPCPMCAGAVVQSRIKRVVIGAPNYKAGSAGTLINVLSVEKFNHQVEISWGVLEIECCLMLKNFFKELREKHSKKQVPASLQESQVNLGEYEISLVEDEISPKEAQFTPKEDDK